MDVLTIDPIQRLNKDLKNAAKILTPGEVRYLVDSYYTIQEYRKAAGSQVRACNESGEPGTLIEWFFSQHDTLENDIKKALDIYTSHHPIGVWTKSIVGIGPVISAGLLAHIDITKAPTVGHIWNFAGLNPEQKWEKKQKRPWNARLKVLCWKIGESFVKVSNNPNDMYGKLYKARKEQEQRKNEAGEFAAQAAAILQSKKIGKDTEAFKHYSVGQLPPAHIHARACRYAVKIFLAHLHEVWYRWHFGEMPPKPYVIEHKGHAHKIEPPNLHILGLEEKVAAIK